jgi:hypothetical protein
MRVNTGSNGIFLMFPYYFPPENAIGGVRPFRFYKYLSRFGQRCYVFTASDQTNQPKEGVEYVPDPFCTGAHRDFGDYAELLIRKMLLPGVTGVRWSRRASAAARLMLRKLPGVSATIFSTYPPLGPHLVARELAATEHVRWIADFRDPLTDNPSDYKHTVFQRAITRRIEKTIFASADLILANTDLLAEKWKRQYPWRSGDIHTIWNGFDPEERIERAAPTRRDYKAVSHVGELYGGRDATQLVESFCRLIGAGRLSASRIRVRFIGPANENLLGGAALLGRGRTEGWLDAAEELVPRSQAQRIASDSDGLILVQPHSAIQVPGKLFEYISLSKPILAYLARGSATEAILEKSGVAYRCVYSDTTPQQTDEIILEFCGLLSKGTSYNAWFEERFNAERQARTLHEMIRTLQKRF